MSRPVLTAVAEVLADLGLAELAGAADGADVEDAVLRAVGRVRLFSPPMPTGSVRQDLLGLVQRWLGCPTRDERAMAVLLSAAHWHPRIRAAIHEALDLSLAASLTVILGRATNDGPPLDRIPLLTWILRSVAVDRLRSGHPRTQVDLEQLVDHLLCPLERGPR